VNESDSLPAVRASEPSTGDFAIVSAISMPNIFGQTYLLTYS